MPDEPQTRLFETWPADPHQREELARELLGEHLVYAYDAWVGIAAEMLFKGYRYKSPRDEQERFLNWIKTLTDEDRHAALAFVRDIVRGVVFSILNHFDGTTGAVLQHRFREQLRVVVDIYEREPPGGLPPAEPVERLEINSKESARSIDLHNLWNDWLARYSRSRSEPDV
jgi:hypothetical protein